MHKIIISFLMIISILNADEDFVFDHVENGIVYVKEKTKYQKYLDNQKKLKEIIKKSKNDITYIKKLYYMYKNGSKLTKKIFKKEFYYLKILANSGDSFFQKELAELYFYGYGWQLKHNFKKSFKWYKKSAQNGDVESMFFTGNMYLKGIGTKKDKLKAKFWFNKAKKYDEEGAIYFLNKI